MEAAGLEAKDGFMRANMAMRGLCGGGLEDCPNGNWSETIGTICTTF